MANSDIDITGPFDTPRKLLRVIDTGEGLAETRYAIASMNLGSIVNVAFDAITIPSYDVNNNPLTVQYRTGGTSGTVVCTLTLVWTGTNITSVARS